MTVPDPWAEVAAAGTDPELLARVVARRSGQGGDPRALARAIVARHLAAPDAPAERLLGDVVGRPSSDDRARADAVAATWRRLQVRAALVSDPAYPHRLAAGWPGTGAPLVLAWRGPSRGLPDGPAVAIVGARRATAYGTGIAAWLAEAAAAAGVTVISGGAVGIDAAAHEAALAAPSRGPSGATAAVLGCGHAVAYPRAHARSGGLFARILAADGWLVSELLPDEPPRPAAVLARNRIVAGLVDAVVVVEGRERSGALRTAAMAADRGVQVLAVPGDVRAAGSAAPHQLLREGAAPCTGPSDLLEAIGTSMLASSAAPAITVLPDALAAELARRWPRPIRTEELAAVTSVPVGAVMAAVTRARVAGEVAEGPEGVRLTRAPPAPDRDDVAAG